MATLIKNLLCLNERYVLLLRSCHLALKQVFHDQFIDSDNRITGLPNKIKNISEIYLVRFL